jgi:hypothetical protein
VARDIEKFTGNNYFCGASRRPDCLKAVSHKSGNNICCLYCDITAKCIDENKSKVKPCTTKDIGFDEYCEFSV